MPCTVFIIVSLTKGYKTDRFLVSVVANIRLDRFLTKFCKFVNRRIILDKLVIWQNLSNGFEMVDILNT